MFKQQIAALQAEVKQQVPKNSLQVELRELKSRLDKNEQIYRKIGEKLNLF